MILSHNGNGRHAPLDPVAPDRTPASIEAEESVLGSILIEPDRLSIVRSILSPADFWVVRNGWVFEAMLSLHGRGMAVDYVTICEELDRRGQLAELGGPAHVAHLSNSVPIGLHAESYARLVEAAAIRRRMLSVADELARLAYDEDGDVDAQLSQAARSIQGVLRASPRTVNISDAARAAFEELSEWSQSKLPPGAVRGLSCGLRSVDLLIGGFEPELLYILAGRPGMGKSALGFQIGFNVARAGRRVLMFSIDMNQRQVLRRWIAMLSGVPGDGLRRGDVPDDKWPDIVHGVHNVISDLPIVINDSGRVTTGLVESETARYHPDLIVVDHLRLMSDASLRGENETQRLGRMSWSLKQIAKEYRVPVLCLCQLNRSLESRDDKRPMLSDLRQSGEIEENADDVLMLYREDMYNDQSDKPGLSELWGRKLRDGDANSMAQLYYKKSLTTFYDVESRAI